MSQTYLLMSYIRAEKTHLLTRAHLLYVAHFISILGSFELIKNCLARTRVGCLSGGFL